MAEANIQPRDPRYALAGFSHNQEERILSLEWGDGHHSRLPYIWLRHHRFFPALGRPDQEDDGRVRLPDVPEELALHAVQPGEGSLELAWAGEDKMTRHDLAWLRDNCLCKACRTRRQPKPVLWDGKDAEDFRWFEASELEDSGSRFELFLQVRDYGLALVRNVPVEPGTIMELSKHFGPVRRTHHGSLFDIRSLPEDRQGVRANIGATAANTLAPHTDEGFRHAPLGIMLFHCLKPDVTGRGASTFVDGIAAAEELRKSDPEAFGFLTRNALVLAAERNALERFRTRARLIATDRAGVVRGVRMADRTLPPMDLPEDQIEEAYRALRAFSSALYAPHRVYERVLKPGEMAVFDNQRVLHSRKSFNREAGERHLQQVSIERDEFHNLFRQLAEQVGRYDLANWEPDAGALTHS